MDVWIGRPGELLEKGVTPHPKATRIGGFPTYPEGSEAIPDSFITCDICSQKMLLMLQVRYCLPNRCRLTTFL
jgi:hypothetical protein